MTAAGHAFGRRLRDARERKGVTLEAVAEATKINMSLLAGLERGDVSRWPRGIFRRAFVREYATVIGLQPAAVLVEFSRLFPEEGEEPQQPIEPQQVDGGLRLMLAVDEAPSSRRIIAHVLAAALDLGALVTLAVTVRYFTGIGLWATSGVVGLIYYLVTTAWLGRSVASWWVDEKLRNDVKAGVAPARSATIAPDRFRIVSQRRDSPRQPSSLEPELERTPDAPAVVAVRR